MTDAYDTQLSPVEAPPADDTIVLVAKPDTGIKKDLQATCVLALLDWKIWLPPPSYWWINWPVLPLWLTVW